MTNDDRQARPAPIPLAGAAARRGQGTVLGQPPDPPPPPLRWVPSPALADDDAPDAPAGTVPVEIAAQIWLDDAGRPHPGVPTARHRPLVRLVPPAPDTLVSADHRSRCR